MKLKPQLYVQIYHNTFEVIRLGDFLFDIHIKTKHLES